MQPWVFLTQCIGNSISLPIHAFMHFIHTLGTMREISVGEGTNLKFYEFSFFLLQDQRTGNITAAKDI